MGGVAPAASAAGRDPLDGFMLELMQRLVSLDWRRTGGVIKELPVAGSSIWYAEFPAHLPGRPAGSSPGRRAGPAPTLRPRIPI